MSLLKPVFSGLYSHFAVMAELADAADLGSVVFNVQVQVLLTAFRNASAVLIFKSVYFIRFRVFL